MLKSSLSAFLRLFESKQKGIIPLLVFKTSGHVLSTRDHYLAILRTFSIFMRHVEKQNSRLVRLNSKNAAGLSRATIKKYNDFCRYHFNSIFGHRDLKSIQKNEI